VVQSYMRRIWFLDIALRPRSSNLPRHLLLIKYSDTYISHFSCVLTYPLPWNSHKTQQG